MRIKEVYELPGIEKFLQKRWLVSQYLKAVDKLKSGIYGKIDFKKRQPVSKNIWAFRINKQYRAIGYFRKPGIFVVVKISDHQKE